MANLQQLPTSSTSSILKNDEDKALVEQMMKQSESVLLSESPNLEKEQPQTVGCLLNLTTRGRLQIHCKHDWCGQVSVRAMSPPEISTGGTAKFVHNGASPNGSKAAIVYASINKVWLLAWSVSLHDEPNKVYVEDGPKENYSAIDWYEIERKLYACSNISFHENLFTKTKSFAQISDGKKAKLGAVFLD